MIFQRKPNPIGTLLCYLFAIALMIFRWNQPTPDPGSPMQAEFITALIIGLILSATLLVLSELLRPDPNFENAKPAGEGDFNFPTATEGRVVPLLWGRSKLSGPNVTWWGDFRQVPVKETLKTGLWSKKRITTGFQYFVGIDMALCQGGRTGVTLHQVYIGDKPVTVSGGLISEPNLLGGNEFGAGGIIGTVGFFDGTLTQARSTYLGLHLDPLSAQRGTSHLVFEGGYIGNTTSIKPWAFELSRFPSLLLDDATSAGQNGSYGAGENVVLSNDANLMEVAYEIIRDGDWGMGRLSGSVDLVSFSAAASTLHDEGNGFSMQLERITSARELLNLIQEQADGVIYLDRRTGKYKVTLARQDYVTSATVSSVSGTDTYNVAADGSTFDVGSTVFAEGHDNPENNGRKTVASRTASTVVVNETLVNETPAGVASISSLNGVDQTNRTVLKSFARQTWDGTTNQVRIEFSDRTRDYNVTFARADNLANQRMQKGEIITATTRLPGVKNGALANSLAARNIRFLSFPLAKATVVVNRDFWDLNPGDVIRLSDENLGFVNLVMRVISIDFGNFENGDITIRLMQDIFSLEAGFFGVPPAPLWEQPVQGVLPIPVNEHQVFEAPKKLIDLDVLFPGRRHRVFVGARAQAGETAIKIFQRNDTGTPSGAYDFDGQNEGLFLIGSLNVALAIGNANPTPTMQISGSPDAKVRIQLSFDPEGASPAEIGQLLANVIKVGDEFLGVEGLTDAGGNLLNFTNAYRGLLDSVPADHDVGAFVYLLYVSGGMNDTTIPPGNFVDVQPRTVSRDEELTEGDSKTFALQMDNRYLRPYPPSAIEVDTVRFPSTPTLDDTITNPGGDTEGVDLEWLRRDWENLDEVVALTDDAEILTPGFQAKHDHESLLNSFVIDADALRIRVGALNATYINGNTGVVARSDIVSMTDGELPSGYIPSIQVRHTVDSVTRLALVLSEYECAPTSADLGALVNLGTVFANGPISRIYTVATATIHSFTEGTSITGVQFRLNGGAWTAIGSFPAGALAVNDTLEFRHGDTSESPFNTTGILDDGTIDVAYVVFNTSTEFESLVAYWNMNEVSTGVSQVDRGVRFGGAIDFTDVNDCESIAGAPGSYDLAVRCRDNASTLEYLRILDAAADDISLPDADWTVTGWFYVEDISFGNLQVLIGHFDLASTSPFTDRSFFISSHSTLGWQVVIYHTGSGNLTSVVSSTAHADATWAHIGVTFDQSLGRIDLWVNGVSVANGTIGGGGSFHAGTGVAANITVGGFESGGTPQDTFVDEVRIDDLRIYHRLLAGSEILAIAGATQPLS